MHRAALVCLFCVLKLSVFEPEVLNSVQSVSKEDIDGGTTYLGLMQENYETRKADLG